MAAVLQNSRSFTAASAGNSSPLRTLSVTNERVGSALIVSGEVDACNESAWTNLLIKLGATVVAPGPFVVDVRGMAFMGSGAFCVLGRQAQRCRRRGVNVRVVSTEPIVARVAAVLGLRTVLSLHPTVRAALSETEDEACRRTRR